MKCFLFVLFLSIAIWEAHAQTHADHLQGTIIDSLSAKPLAGGSVRLKGSSRTVLSGADGSFRLPVATYPATVIISYIGYHVLEKVISNNRQPQIFQLSPSPQELEEVRVSTGYETLPSERITGSFEQVNETLFNRSVGTDVLSRLEGITAAIQFDRRTDNYNTTSNSARISLRGPSTIRSDGQPLIILDNFPYEGDPRLINPNEVASVTLLKDAAAASIWGARAGNGVIVITTKQASLDQPTRLQFNSMVSVAEKLNFHSAKPMSSTDYIDVEQFLFEQGYFNNQLNSTAKTAVSPVVDLLWQAREGLVDPIQAKQTIGSWRQHDVVDDFQRYVYRNPLNQQYALTVSGGDDRHGYTVMGGFDKNLEPLRSNNLSRINLRADNRFKVTDRLELQSGIRWTQRKTGLQLSDAGLGYDQLTYGNRSIYPYARLADGEGNALPFPKDFRGSYASTAGNGQLLDWLYRPLDEATFSRARQTQDIRLNASASYRILPELFVEAHYMHQFTRGSDHGYYPAKSYYARNLINRYTQLLNGEAVRIIPEGGILQQSADREDGYSIRGQANYQRTWGEIHRISALAGAEVRAHRTLSGTQLPIYGYDGDNLTYTPTMDFVTRFPIYDGLQSNRVIPGSISLSDRMNRFVSLFVNASYTYRDRYVFSTSARRDASNVFGVAQNQKWTPLWSAGLSWLLSEEPFYSVDVFPYVKGRLTYGYSGNILPEVSALTTLVYYPRDGTSGLPYATAENPPNPHLRWEKVRTLNVGLDFEIRNKRLSGSVDYYTKETRDLFANERIDPTLGFGLSAMKNTANMEGRGFDVTMRTRNLTGALGWNTSLLMGYHKTIVTKYLLNAANASNYVSEGTGINPIEGATAYPIYSYRWGGLDPRTGNPVGYLNGETSTDYRDITRDTPVEDLILHGSSRPLYSGAVRNDFSYGPLSLSVNITWAAAYYFRRPSLSYQALFANGRGHAEFTSRWQQPGEESQTTVPSFVYPLVSNRDDFYQGSSVNVVKGDHIRLQDVRLDYRIGRFTLYAYANNLGVLWTANAEKLDPVYRGGIRPARTYTFGCNAKFNL